MKINDIGNALSIRFQFVVVDWTYGCDCIDEITVNTIQGKSLFIVGFLLFFLCVNQNEQEKSNRVSGEQEQ